MTTKIIKTMMLTAALTIAWGCSSDNNDENVPTENVPTENPSTFAQAEKPAWSVDMTGSDAAPYWGQLNLSAYESKMYITVKLQDELVKHSTDDDEMAVFIAGERRTQPIKRNVDNAGNIYFVLTIRGSSNDRGVAFALSYYSAGLHRLFTIEGKETFAPELRYGITEDFVPPLLKGFKKFPVQNSLTVSLPNNLPFTPDSGDLVAVFMGEECRGAGSVGKAFTVYRTSTEESLQLRYYSVQKGGIYTLKQSVGGEKDITLGF